MSNFDFFVLFAERYEVFIITILFALVVMVYLLRRICSSWLNPAAFSILTACIGLSVAAFLYLTGNSSASTFWYVIVSSIIFWSLIVVFFPKNPGVSRLTIKEEYTINKNLFFICYAVYITLNLLTYYLLGIPLFNDDSRLTTYVGSGLGIFARMIPILQVYIIFYILCQYDRKRITILGVIKNLIPVIVIGVLNGSRSSFIEIVFSFWGYRTLFRGDEPKLIKFRKLLIPFILISLFTFSIEAAGDYNAALYSFGERIVACGDLYWQSMPDDLWKELSVKTPFQDLFLGLLGPLRIINVANCDEALGFQINHLANHTDSMTGPVALFPISSMVYFGKVGGIFFTIIQAFLSVALCKLFYKKSHSLIVCALNYYGFKMCLSYFTSIDVASGYLFDTLLAFVFLLSLSGLAFFLKYITSLNEIEYKYGE